MFEGRPINQNCAHWNGFISNMEIRYVSTGQEALMHVVSRGHAREVSEREIVYLVVLILRASAGTAIQTSLKYLHSYMSTSSYPGKPRLAFLGPPGTYSHQAVYERFGDSVEYVARPTISGELHSLVDKWDRNRVSSDVQQALSAAVPFGILPQENSINGSVVETYNALRIPEVGRETFVRGVTVFAVRHNLVTRRGVKLEDIEKVLSHEQALGQCRGWLAKHLPRASLVSTSSTANAAKRLLSPEDGLDTMRCAAICSSVVVTIYKGLEILAENIQDRTENFTRFYILSWGQTVTLPEGCQPSTESMALLRLQAPLLGNSVETNLDIPRVIRTLDTVVVKRIDRRPSVGGRPFDNVYFLEIGAIQGQNSPDLSWEKQVHQVVDRVKRMDVEVSVLGCW